MADKTSIEWTATHNADGTVTPGATWNPIRGQNARHTCARISPGCDNCYAATMTRRGLMGTAPIDYGTGETLNDPARLDEVVLMQPLQWKKPRRIFVASMTDIAGAWVPDEWLDLIWAVMALAPHHTYLILTKRPSRLWKWFQSDPYERVLHQANRRIRSVRPDLIGIGISNPVTWGYRHIWIGVSVELDRFAWRATVAKQIPAAVHWVSAEPLLGPLPSLDLTGIDWLVAGGESGPGSRPMSPGWARDLRDRCQESGTAYFFKQWGSWAPYQYVGSGVQGQGKLPESNGGNYVLTDDGHWLVRRNKKLTGRLLDGRTWDEYPTAAAGARP